MLTSRANARVGVTSVSNHKRYPKALPHAVDAWRIASFEVKVVSPLAVLNDPAALVPSVAASAGEQLRQAVRRSGKAGRFVPRDWVDTSGKSSFGTMVISRDTLPRLRKELLEIDSDKVTSVQQFLERWGMLQLRVGLVPDTASPFEAGRSDDVAWTQKWIAQLQLFFNEPKEWLPRLYQILAMRGSAASSSGTFTLVWGPDGPQPRVHWVGLLDAILMALPWWAQEPPPRRCAGCQEVIPSPRTRQSYCRDGCATAQRVRKFKRKGRVLGRLAQGDSIADVATRYRMDIREVQMLVASAKKEQGQRRAGGRPAGRGARPRAQPVRRPG